MRTCLTILVLTLCGLTAFADDKEITISSGNAAVLKLTVPQETKVTTKGEKTTLEAKNLWIYLWHITSAKSVSEIVPRVGEVIKSEFTDFAMSETKTITVSGHEAKHLMGKGAEADDGDPGTADVVLFTDGKRVFAACVHGEKTEAAKERPDLLKVLKSAKAP